MTEQNHENNNGLQPQSPEKNTGEHLDDAARSLSEALRISFIALKVIMAVLVIAFLVSGFKIVGSDEQALVLRFGKISSVGEKRVLGPGAKLLFPYPIHEIVKIPVAKKVNLPIDAFWYYEKPSELLPEGPRPKRPPANNLDPIKDGYCITRSEKQDQIITGSTGSDYNIVHCKWQLTYKIDDPERFFKNVYVEDPKPGEPYFDVITRKLTPFLEDLVASSVVTAMVNYTIDEAILSQDRIPKHVRKLLQEKLDQIESGIKVVSIQLTDVTWPRQVDAAFLNSFKASQASQKTISEAKLYAEETLNKAAGPVAEQLLAALNDESEVEQKKEFLWSQLAGEAQEKIAQAKAYRTTVVETARANAEYLEKILPEYRKRPKLVVQKIYQDAIEYVLNNTDEKIIIQPAKGTKGKEIRILLNRDPAIRPKSQQEE